MMPEIPVIDLQDVWKWYDDGKPVLADFNLRIYPGERVAIVGKSGCGKSTLLNILATLDEGSAGSYLFDGQPVFRLPQVKQRPERVSSLSPLSLIRKSVRSVRRFTGAWANARHRRKMGFVFQTPFMLANFDLSYNIALSYRIAHGSAPSEEALSELLDVLELTPLRHQSTETLSGGQRQRVAIGRAVLSRPRVVFADEPTGNLDPSTALNVMKHLTQVTGTGDEGKGTPLVLVTHEPKLAAQFTERQIGIRQLKPGQTRNEVVVFQHGNAKEIEDFLKESDDSSEDPEVFKEPTCDPLTV